MDARELIEERLDKLAALGSSDQIRDFFVAEQLTGYQASGESCVVALYLQRELIAEQVSWGYVGVAAGGVTVRPGGSDYSTKIEVPPTVSRMIRRFDHGRYPELVRQRN